MAVLYRKYRPQNFSEVVGQKHIVTTLQNALSMDKIAHAYLFTGTRGVGKTSVARILAKALNCTNLSKTGDACGKCQICKSIEAGQYLDLIEVDAASNTGVENVRELIEHARFKPSSGRYKIFIIDEVHMLSKGAFNALLKTLEEPPLHVVFILATTEIQKVPATIISRTQRFDFGSIEKKEIAEAIEKILKEEKFKLSKELVGLVASRAEGSMRDGLSILDKVVSLGSNPEAEQVRQLLGVSDISDSLNLTALIIEKNSQGILDLLANMQSAGRDLQIFNKEYLEYLRKILVFNLSKSEEVLDFSAENLEIFKNQASQISAAECMRIIRLFLRSFNEMSQTPDQSLPLLLAALEVFIKPVVNSSPVVSQVNKETKQSSVTETMKPAPAPKVSSQTVERFNTGENSTTQEVDLNLVKIKDHWPEVLAEIKKTNSPLATMVKKAVIYGNEGSKLIFEVRFAFDKQSLENVKNSQVIRAAIEKVCGEKVGIYAKITKKDDNLNTDKEVVLSDALSVFEGELVE